MVKEGGFMPKTAKPSKTPEIPQKSCPSGVIAGSVPDFSVLGLDFALEAVYRL